MPQQVNGVVIAQNADGTQSVLVGPDGFPSVNLFDRNFDMQQVADNIRLAALISGTMLGSVEFLNAVNHVTAGLFAADLTYFIQSVVLSDPANGIYAVACSTEKNGSPFTFQVTQADLDTDSGDVSVIVPNIRSFLRHAGYANMTQVIGGKTAAQAVAAWNFWY